MTKRLLLMGRQSSLVLHLKDQTSSTMTTQTSRILNIFKMSRSSRTYMNPLNILIIGIILIASISPSSCLSIATKPKSITESTTLASTVTDSSYIPVTHATSSLEPSTTESLPSSSSSSSSTSPNEDGPVSSTIPPTLSTLTESPIIKIQPDPHLRTSKRMELANTPFIRLNRMNTGSRTNSRFLKKFPPLEYLQFARRDGLLGHTHNNNNMAQQNFHHHQQQQHPSSSLHHDPQFQRIIPSGSVSSDEEDFNFDDDDDDDVHGGGGDPSLNNQLGNSPIFYIKLPPAPYVLVPGLGYVSPHPYQNNNNIGGSGSSGGGGDGFGSLSGGSSFGASPMMMSPLGSLNFDMSDNNNNPNNVISLPLKFISNARPAIVIGAKPNIENGIHGPDDKHHHHAQHSSKHPTLLSGGKYSFNGRPNGVFIVRSPVASRRVNNANNNHNNNYQSNNNYYQSQQHSSMNFV